MSTPKFNVVEIAAWLREQCDQSGVPSLTVTISPSETDPAFAMAWDGEAHVDASASSIEKAIAIVKESVSPAGIARRKRERAAQLHAEAVALEVEGRAS